MKDEEAILSIFLIEDRHENVGVESAEGKLNELLILVETLVLEECEEEVVREWVCLKLNQVGEELLRTLSFLVVINDSPELRDVVSKPGDLPLDEFINPEVSLRSLISDWTEVFVLSDCLLLEEDSFVIFRDLMPFVRQSRTKDLTPGPLIFCVIWLCTEGSKMSL